MAVFAATVSGCGDRPPSSPASPSSNGGSITISGVRALSETETAALTATLQRPNGETSDVTRTATWSTDAPGVAAVDGQGVVTALAPGSAQVRATLQDITGTTTLTVAAASRVLRGTVHETAPTEGVAIAGAMIRLIDSGGTTRTAVSDAAGSFIVSARPGAAAITISAAGYDETTRSITVGTETPLSVGLVPSLREVRVLFASQPPSPSLLEVERTFRLNVHHAGELRVTITGESVSHGDGYGLFCMDVRDASNRLLARSQGGFDFLPFPIRQRVTPGYYEVKILVCRPAPLEFISAFPSFSVTTFSGEIKHPS